jgi:hypothetical protein
VLKVAANGSLLPVPGSPFPGNPTGHQLSINRSGTLLYINGEFGTLGVSSIASSGAVTAVPGSPFLVGSSTLPSISAFPPKECVFDFCLQDDSNGNRLQFSSVTGDYQFVNCSKGITLSGKGSVIFKSCKVELQDMGPDPKRPDRNVSAIVNTCNRSGSATIQIFSQSKTFLITDTNITGNTCVCPGVSG